MANIDPIRRTLEGIFEQNFGRQFVEKCPTEQYPTRYKLTLTPLIDSATRTQKRMVLDLPHVVEVRCTDESKLIVYFDCKPSQIVIRL